MLPYYYLLAVVEHLHWMALFVTLCAFVAMTCSKAAQSERYNATSVRLYGDPRAEDIRASSAFRKSCLRYVIVFGIISTLTPPLKHWVEAKANVATLSK